MIQYGCIRLINKIGSLTDYSLSKKTMAISSSSHSAPIFHFIYLFGITHYSVPIHHYYSNYS
ncbi:hypothetical protein SAMN05421545_3589 [Pontibacter lucknowensis]|uniref:Uncharacterized protein n=1 Tax=Pontibacter lucknowensis TaxID=1077936 RepID=A0A1N7AUB6_9BACT|nr:hypothetical protein SAMN05421545_3589 [Pontibacter lucknowensis]